MNDLTNLKLLHNKLLDMINDIDSFCKLHGIEYVIGGGTALGAVRHQGFIPWDDDLDIYMTRENYNKFLNLFKNDDKYYLQKELIDYPLAFSKLRANNTTFIEDIPYRKKYKKIHQGIFIDIFPIDKVAKNKRQAKLQSIFSNILISQTLAIRGYPKTHRSIIKNVYMFISLLLLPLKNYFINYVSSFNNQKDFDFYCPFYDGVKKVFYDKKIYESPFEYITFENLSLPIMNNYELYLTKTYGDYMKLPSESEREYAVHAVSFSVTEDYTKTLRDK